MHAGVAIHDGVQATLQETLHSGAADRALVQEVISCRERVPEDGGRGEDPALLFYTIDITKSENVPILCDHFLED